jgi:hypothetical protein
MPPLRARLLNLLLASQLHQQKPVPLTPLLLLPEMQMSQWLNLAAAG